MPQDINITYEGDNSILIQQTAKFLMEGMGKLMAKKPITYDSIQFLSILPAIGQQLEFKSVEEFHSNHQLLLKAMEWRVLLVNNSHPPPLIFSGGGGRPISRAIKKKKYSSKIFKPAGAKIGTETQGKSREG